MTDTVSLAGRPSCRDSVPYVITLVHGTWAKEAPWTRSYSLLSKALRERLPPGAKIFPFVWTGKNSHHARRQASERLQRKLALRLQNYVGARHYIISHSHGGNVVFRALAEAGLSERIAGVVCLATPFLVARERDLGRDPTKHLAGALVVLMLLVVGLLDQVLLPALWPGLVRFMLVVLVTSGVMGAIAFVVKRWREYAGKIRHDLESVRIDSNKLLIVRSPADEAGAALALFQFVSQLTVRFYVRVMGLYGTLETAAKAWARQKGKMLAVAAGGLGACVGLLFVAASLPWDAAFQSPKNAITIGAVLIALMTSVGAILLVFGWVEVTTILFRFAASAVMWPVIILLSVLLLPFGWEIAVANILLDVTAETTPPGSWTVHLIEPLTSKELGRDVLPLIHSMIYDNPRVVKIVCDWVASEDVPATAQWMELNGKAGSDKT